jgi:hypothetical protein
MTIEMQVLADYLDPNHPFLITVSTTAMHINKPLKMSLHYKIHTHSITKN